MRVLVIGGGRVGSATSCYLARIGHEVTCVEKDGARLGMLSAGRSPYAEEGLNECIERNRIVFGSTCPPGVYDICFVCVATPVDAAGVMDERQVVEACSALPRGEYPVVVRSTITPLILRQARAIVGARIAVCPEFLREGRALTDTIEPTRLVIGAYSKAVAETVETCFCYPNSIPRFLTTPEEACLIKLGSNLALGIKTSLANFLSVLCAVEGCDARRVLDAIAADPRIGPGAFRPGPGVGGPCLPKDTRATYHLAASYGMNAHVASVLQATNSMLEDLIVRRVCDLAGCGPVAGFGLAFKAGTDDTAESVAVRVYERLRTEGLSVSVFDPALTPDRDPYAVVEGATCLLVMTEWQEFLHLDWSEIRRRMKRAQVYDARMMLEPLLLRQCGIAYFPLGS
ncbi:MAG: nucleotide sugar dehydrogenase [Bacillota bacterium]